MGTQSKANKAKSPRSSQSDTSFRDGNDSHASTSGRATNSAHSHTSYVSTASSEGIRLNPAVAKRKGLRLLRDEDSNLVVDLTHGSSTNGLSPVDDCDERNEDKLKMQDGRNDAGYSKRVLVSMFREDGIGCCGNVGAPIQTRENYKMPPKQVKWWQVTLFLLNDISEAYLMLFSVIVLALNGWILGIILILALWPMSMYVAHLLWRCRNVFPGAISIGDLVYYVSGSCWAMYIAFVMVNLTIALTLSYNVIVSAASVYWLSGLTSGKCFVTFLGGVCLVLLPMSQLRTLHSLTFINAMNFVCMLCFAGIFMYFLARNGPLEGAETQLAPNSEAWQNFFSVEAVSGPLSGVNALISSYHYQLLILEIMAEMKDPREFPKANYWCTPAVLLVTLGCATFRYYYQGEKVDLILLRAIDVINSAFKPKEKSVLAYFGITCLAIKMLGSCLIRSVILTRFMQLLIHPQFVNVRTWRSRLEWAGISVFVLGLVYLLSVLTAVLPSLTRVLAILVVICTLLLPILLYVICKRYVKQVKLIPWYEWVLMAIIILISIFTIIFSFVKFGADIHTLIDMRNNYTVVSFNMITDCQAF